MTEAIPRMIEALDLEVAEIRRKGGGAQVLLRGGERVGKAEGSWLYRFVVLDELHLRDDTPVRVVCGQQEVSGVAVSFRDGVLVVALDEDLGPTIATALLVTDDAFLLERLKEALERVRTGEVQHRRLSAERVLGLASPDVGEAEPHPAVLEDGRANADQIVAIRRSLGSDTTFVWGPPGTGKTTTLARIVEAHYRSGRSVLLVSNTNIAVDTALERVAERLEGETDFHQGLVIRQGPVVKEELRHRFGPQVILEEIVARLGAPLWREKNDLEQEVGPLEAEERSLQEALRTLERLAEAQAKLAAREKSRDAARAQAATREREAEEHRARAARHRADLEGARTMGALRRFLSGLKPETLARQAEAAERAAQAAVEAARALWARVNKEEAEIRELRAEVDRLSAETHPYPPASVLERKLDSARARLEEIRKRIAAIEGELANLEQKILARCRILATTVYRTYLGKGASREFDAVVIDEASMLMPPLVYYVAGLATSAVTVAGDFRQLPPIVMSEEPLVAEWLRQDVFEKAGIPELVEQRRPVPHLVTLGTQFRMREPICELVNELFYPDHPLCSDPSVRRGGDDFPLSSSPLLYVDTAPFHPWTALRAGTYSRYNLFHALLVRNVVLHLAETGYLPPEGEPNDVLGAVAPYASQARLIQALLDDRLGPRAAGIAATVHRFQGNEKRSMVLDLTDSIGTWLGRFLKATRIEEDGARLLNVAVSRARHHVILLGNFAYLRRKAPERAVVRRLLDHFQQHGEALDLEGLLPLAERDWIDGLHRVLPASFDFPDGAAGVFTEGTFYPAFLQDLGRACESIVILSPFATGPGTARWVDPLRAALARGVRVRILTRPAGESAVAKREEVEDLVRALRDLGVVVDLRSRMHEKIAILDGRILWHGSLNILSHRDTSESMLRIESPAACQQLAGFLSTPLGPSEGTPTPTEPENPPCPLCGGPTVWNRGRYGIWFACENPSCEGKVDARQRGRGARTRGGSRGTPQGGAPGRGRGGSFEAGRPCPEPGCDGRLVERRGRRGPFLGCTRYPACRHTEDVD